MLTIHQEIRRGASLVWHEANPIVIRLLAHLVIFAFAALCLAAMLVITCGLLTLCELLFKDIDIYVKAVCIIGEVLLYLYLTQFANRTSIM